MNEPTVSLIIPVYNGGLSFRNCVKSLFDIRYPIEKLQIILVDDGSTDDTFEWLQAQSLPSHMIIVHHNVNRGRAAARNSGISQTNGEILIFIDGDMRIHPDCVQAHMEAHNLESVFAVAGKMIPDPNLPRTRLQRYLFEYSQRGAKQFGEQSPIGFQYLLTGNMSLKRDVLDVAGLFDETMSGYGGEDTLFAFRIWKTYPLGIRYCLSAVVTDQQIYILDDLLAKTYHYGKHNLPRLISEFPEMITALRGDYLIGNSWKKWLADIFCNPVFYIIGRFKYHIMPYPLSNWLVRILLMCALRKGFRHRSQ